MPESNPSSLLFRLLSTTALLFGFLLGLNGGGAFQVPNRLAFGLLLGWLGMRLGSLVPCILAHSLSNSLAVFWSGP